MTFVLAVGFTLLPLVPRMILYAVAPDYESEWATTLTEYVPRLSWLTGAIAVVYMAFVMVSVMVKLAELNNSRDILLELRNKQQIIKAAKENE